MSDVRSERATGRHRAPDTERDPRGDAVSEADRVDRDEPVEVSLTVNGVPRSAAAPPRRLLSDFLRHDLGLTGTHVGCEHGVCGCCTVLLDGVPVRSCLTFAISVARQEVTTVEGLTEADGSLSPVQRAFHECHALQCGFCTPGFLITCTAFLRDRARAGRPAPTDEEIVEAISGNLCRCTGYQNIIRAVRRAAELAGDGTAADGDAAGGAATTDGAAARTAARTAAKAEQDPTGEEGAR